MAETDYRIAALYYNVHGYGDSIALLRVFLGPNLLWEGKKELSEQEWWVHVFDWPSLEITESGGLHRRVRV